MYLSDAKSTENASGVILVSDHRPDLTPAIVAPQLPRRPGGRGLFRGMLRERIAALRAARQGNAPTAPTPAAAASTPPTLTPEMFAQITSTVAPTPATIVPLPTPPAPPAPPVLPVVQTSQPSPVVYTGGGSFASPVTTSMVSTGSPSEAMAASQTVAPVPTSAAPMNWAIPAAILAALFLSGG